MNLKNYFNLEYAKQNLKKSKGALALFAGIIPILNIIFILLTCFQDDFVLDLTQISLLNIIFFCITPVVISVCLFNYIFKKKSVDFIGSMPISRKSIFITNSIVGIAILGFIVLINALMMLLVSAIGIYPFAFQMILDYILIWLISYIFVFIISNIAMSIAGNAITQIIVIFCLLISIPFTIDYVKIIVPDTIHYNHKVYLECNDKECTPETFNCYEDENCLELKKENIYRLDLVNINKPSNYTAPYNVIRSFFSGNEINIYNKTSLLKMFILSIVGFFIGFKLFTNRKMENNEVSFKNNKTHALVKGITLLPILLVSYQLLTDANIGIVLLLLWITLITGFYFLYDLISKKGIQNFISTIKYLIITILIVFTFAFITEKLTNRNNEIYLNVDNFEYIEIKNEELSISSNDYPKITNKRLLKEIMKYTATHYLNKDEVTVPMSIEIKQKDNTLIRYTMYSSKEDYDKLMENIKKSADYIQYKAIDYKKIYAFNINELNKVTDKERNILKDIIQKMDKEEIKPTGYYRLVDFYLYDQGKITTYTVPSYYSEELSNLVEKELSYENKKIKELLEDEEYDKIKRDIVIYSSFVSSSNDVSNDFNYILERAEKEIFEMIKNKANTNFSTKGDYATINIYYQGSYKFMTNDVEKLIEIINKKREEIKDDEEYLNWINYQKEEQIIIVDGDKDVND
ncbi:MAG: ABC transporter permease [Firmicutes bacterium]|nr:ABC transporter permease [Bacillota bacterium]